MTAKIIPIGVPFCRVGNTALFRMSGRPADIVYIDTPLNNAWLMQQTMAKEGITASLEFCLGQVRVAMIHDRRGR